MRILLVQHPSLRLKRMLLREGYTVETAIVKEASDSMARAADVIVLDVKADGQDAVASLKGWRERNIQTPVLALAAEEAATEKIAALDAGADAFMVKPCDDAELRAQVRALLRRVAADAEARVRIFDLELGVGERMVRRAGQPIKLTRREFQLLNLLASNRGKVVTRAQIWAQLGGRSEESASNLIDVYIRYLRKKIDAGFELPLILTAWGEGYMLRGDSELVAAG